LRVSASDVSPTKPLPRMTKVSEIPEMADYSSRVNPTNTQRTFGVPLDTVKRSPPHNIPFIVELTIAALEKTALTEEGILRLAGSNSEIKRLKDAYDNGEEPDLSKVDTHAIAGVLKLWFRELPRPPLLITVGLKASEDLDTDEERAEILIKELRNIPDVNYMTLKRLFSFCHSVAANSAKTKMMAQNIGMVFSPTLNLSLEVIVTMTKLYDQVFAEDRPSS